MWSVRPSDKNTLFSLRSNRHQHQHQHKHNIPPPHINVSLVVVVLLLLGRCLYFGSHRLDFKPQTLSLSRGSFVVEICLDSLNVFFCFCYYFLLSLLVLSFLCGKLLLLRIIWSLGLQCSLFMVILHRG